MLNPDKIPHSDKQGAAKDGNAVVRPDEQNPGHGLEISHDSENGSPAGQNGVATDSFHPVDIKDLNETFDKVFREHRVALKMRAAQIVGSQETAEDVVNDVFLKTYRLITDGKEINVNTIDGWLFRCVQNASFNVIRKRKRSHNVPLKDDDPDLAALQDVGDQAYSEDRSMQVLDTVSELPIKQRKAFLLFDVHGLSYKEAASEMHTSSSSVRQLLYRARTNIRKNLGPETAGMAAPMLRSNVFFTEDKSNLIERLIHQISGVITKYFGHFNSLGERLVTVSTPIVAIIVIGVAVVITQTRSEEPAIGATIDPSMLMVSIHSNPVGDLDLIQGQIPPATGSSKTGRDSIPSGISPGIDRALPDISLPRGRSAAIRERLADLLENCKTCNVSVIAAIKSFMEDHNMQPGQVLAAGQGRRQTRRQSRRQTRRQERRTERRSDRREERRSAQASAGTKGSSSSGTKSKGSGTKGKAGSGKSSGSSGTGGKGKDSGSSSDSNTAPTPSTGSGSSEPVPSQPSVPKPDRDRTWTPPTDSGVPSLPNGPFGR